MKFRLVILCLLWILPRAWAGPAIIPPEQAFVVSVPQASTDEIHVEFLIAPGTYLYQKEIKFSADKAKLDQPKFPAGKTLHDPYFGEVIVYEYPVQFQVPVDKTQSQNIALTIAYQGCNETGFCYPPQEKTIDIHLNAGTSPVEVNPTHQALNLLQNAPSAWALVAFFGFGLLLAFTPCVLPMIPILSALIIGEQHKHHRGHAFRLALTYVLGMAMTYAGLGALVASLGAQVQVHLQNPIVLSITAAILIIMAILLWNDKLLGQASRLSQPLHTLSNKLHAGKTWGVGLMGMISALIISPCVTPPLIGALTYISLTGNVLLGASALFLLALGMGVPLLAVAWGGTALLPSRGPWMIYVKQFFSLILIIMAFSLLARFVAPHWDWRHPLETLSKTQKVSSGLHFISIQNTETLEAALTKAAEQGKPVMLDFYADWCTNCITLEKAVFTDPEVQKQLAHLILLKVDVTDYNEATQALMASENVYGPPALIFFDAQGQKRSDLRVDGLITPDKLLDHLQALPPKKHELP